MTLRTFILAAAAVVAIACALSPRESIDAGLGDIPAPRKPQVQGPVVNRSPRSDALSAKPDAALAASQGLASSSPAGQTIRHPENPPDPEPKFETGNVAPMANSPPSERKAEHGHNHSASQSAGNRFASDELTAANDIQPADSLIAATAAPVDAASKETSALLNHIQPAPAAPAKPPVLPLVYTELDAASVGLTDVQLSGVESVREQFWKDIGEGELDPGSQEYRERWRRAQPAADQLLRAIIGQQRFAEYQLRSAREAAAQAGQ